MRRLLLAMLLLTGLAAQLSGGGLVAGQTGPPVGTPAVLLGQDGSEVANITVDRVVDPFEDYSVNYQPSRGHRVILVTLTIEATGAQPFSFNPSNVYGVDDAGYLVAGFYTEVPSDLSITLLTGQDVQPGAPLSGSIALQAYLGATVNSIVYRPQSDRLIELAHLGGTSVAIGTTVSVLANDGSEAAKVTVVEAVEPFDAYDPSSPPERGNHYVLIVVHIENTGVRPMRVDPNAFVLLDSDGFLTGPVYVNRGEDPRPDLAYTDPFEPGQSVMGVIAYQVLSGTTQASVLYLPASDRVIAAGTFGGSGSAAPATPTG